VLIELFQMDGMLSWSRAASWLHTEINVRHRELNPDTVAYLNTNRARRRLTSLIEANALITTPDNQHSASNFGINRRLVCDFLLVTNSNLHPSCTISKLWLIIGQIFAIDKGLPQFNALAGNSPLRISP